MSEKNVGGGRHNETQQWTKSAAAAAATTQKQHHLHSEAAAHHLYEHSTGLLVSPTLYGSSGGGSGGAIGGGLGLATHPDNIASYASARFQPPSIHHASAAAAASAALPTLTQSPLQPPQPLPQHDISTVLTTASSNVPAPSGFVPPPFPPTAAATSVLTPNPFANINTATGSSSGIASGGGSGPPTHFPLDQLSHLNAQQLSKIMNVMNSAAAAATMSLAGNSSVTQQSMVPQQSTAAHIIPRHQSAITDLPTRTGIPDGLGGSAGGVGASGSGVISSAIATNVLNAIGAAPHPSTNANITPIHGRLMGIGVKMPPDDDKMRRIQHVVESGVSDHAKQQILQILDRISSLKPVEKLLLYLRMPGESPETDPLRHPQNPLGTRSEINHTINWVRTHLEHDPQVSIPKQDVYNDYITYCERLDIKPLSTADFGKVMKQVFPGIRPRRLGTRGHSRYCYAAMRKTTKLTVPQLPHLTAGVDISGTAVDSSGVSSEINDASSLEQGEDAESWDVIKTWAESMLNVKVDNIKDLATRIKGNNSSLGAGAAAITAAGNTTRTNVTHKKYAQREPKEKRFLADTGPLKKRRKKKRKGSSSSESSCSQQLMQATSTQSLINNNNNNSKDLSPTTSGYANSTSIPSIPKTEDEQKSIKMVKVKQEILDSPNFQRAQHLPPPQMQAATIGDNYLHQQPQHTLQQQQQMLPMNLATEQRTVLEKAPPVMSAFGAVVMNTQQQQQQQQHRLTYNTTAVKNLTPKIIKMSENAAAAAAAAQEQMPIKEEIIDDYNPTNIFCKKVRKAQQTKGFWVNSPNSSSGNMSVPIITTTASTPPSSPITITTTVIATSSTSIRASTATTGAPAPPPPNVDGTHYLMGPPAQIGASHTTSTSPHTLDVVNAGSSVSASPKVASRNMQSLLRAKKHAAAAAAAAAIAAANDGTAADISDDKDADLSENLGLPRERVISICNMDKHELDDYFLPEEEENSQDQETELLQYFQTGDAEEKLNSLDTVKLRNPTATITQTPATERKSLSAHPSRQYVASESSGGSGIRMQHINSNNSGFATTDVNNAANAASVTLTNKTIIAFTTTTTTNSTISTTSATTATTAAAVGSASASLALMSQKHQQQQLQLNNNNKRKINHADMIQRKNCSFLPISPNINTSNTATHVAVAISINQQNANAGGFFASPGQQSTPRIRPKPSLLMNKQQSLDCDTSDPMIGEIRRRRSYMAPNITTSPSAPPSPSMLQQQQLDSSSNDPMIGASRRRRSYVTFMGNTSASAPPSPSVLQQQQHQQQMYGGVGQHFHNNSWQLSSNNASAANSTSAYNDMSNTDLLNEQNSLDLDLFAAAAATNAHSAGFTQHHTLTLDAAGTTAGTDDFLLTPLNETQRSQSVPLSQLQRIHSPTFNRSYHTANYSACPSVVQTPVPHEFGDSTLCSENSNSQHSVGGHASAAAAGSMKLEDSGVLASDSTAILDEVDVTEILSSPDFVAKFSSIAQGNTATTTCSSAGSSSGYSSGACTSFGTSVMSAIGGGGGGGSGSGIGPSRSVPSTPLPYQQYQHTFGSFYSRRRNAAGGGNDEMHLSPTTVTTGGISSSIGFTPSFKYGNCNAVDRHSYGGGGGGGSTRSTYDISKSMPSTPITTPGFRFSPTEFNRDFLINGNTIDCMTSFGTVGGSGGAGDTLDASDSLISGDAESIMVGSDILGNL